MSYIVLQNIHRVATPKAPKTLLRSPPFALMTIVLECALLIALRSLNFLAVGDATLLRSGQTPSFLDSPPSLSWLFFPKNLPLISTFLALTLA
ncbi:hypothetical protein WN944_006082 [Citrus x changshan-huyou]|uniref:Uncharacterized protein n=1 Tax=Citrus x changshan-huyou TaxID=2935761 RepID=A0AAP0QTG4_9ROSI